MSEAAAAVKAEETEEVEATTEDAKVEEKPEEKASSGASTPEERDALREKFIADGIAKISKTPEETREATTKIFTDTTNEAFDAVEEATSGMSMGQVAAFVFGYSVAATKPRQ